MMNKLLSLSLVALLAGAAGVVDAAPRDGDGRGRHGYDQRHHGPKHGGHPNYNRQHNRDRRHDDRRWHGHGRASNHRPRHHHHHHHYARPPRYRAPTYYVRPHGYRHYRWTAGHYLPRAYYGPTYYVDYRPYRLAPPPYGHHWVRVDNDVLLVALATGLVVDSVYGLFY